MDAVAFSDMAQQRAAAAKTAREAEAAAREAALRAHYDAIEAQRAREAARGPADRADRSAANQVKELALWLLFFMLIGIASRGFDRRQF